jgi:hypothetical protein
MKENVGNHDELQAILTEMQLGPLSDERLEQLRTILRNDEQAQTIYAQQALTQAMLEWEFCDWRASGASDGSSTNEEVHSPRMPHRAVHASSVENGRAAKAAESSARGMPAGSGPSAPKTPIVFNFLSNQGSRSSFLGLSFIVLFAALMTFAGVTLYRNFKTNEQKLAATEFKAEVTPKDDTPKNFDANNAVATLSGGIDCAWKDADSNFKTGSAISVGQVLNLTGGVAELNFKTGVRVLMQSPASIAIESANSVRVNSGKLTNEITSNEGRGFKVLTEDATFTDQGTEFGIEVAPTGNSKIHVFQGSVDIALNAKSGAAYPIQRLEANSGARLEGALNQVAFVEDTGETFMRSLNQAEQDPHVVAYWRFEDHPVGALVPSTTANRFRLSGTFDSSFNGNDLYAHTEGSRPRFSGDVPSALVPQNGKVNRGSMDNTDAPDKTQTRDVYTHSSFSHASPIDIQKIAPKQWTIEASVKLKQLGKKAQTFVGRDAGLPREQAPQARLAFQVNNDDQFAIRFMDEEGRVHQAVASSFKVEPAKWYNVATTSDGSRLQLFVDCMDGRGYQLLATTALPAVGSTALSHGNTKAEWSLGRGKVDGRTAEWFEGWIDEVRICDIALPPTQFLFTKVPGASELTFVAAK